MSLSNLCCLTVQLSLVEVKGQESNRERKEGEKVGKEKGREERDESREEEKGRTEGRCEVPGCDCSNKYNAIKNLSSLPTITARVTGPT